MEKENKEKKEQTPLKGDQNKINETKTGCHKNPVGGTQMTEIDLTQIKPKEAKAKVSEPETKGKLGKSSTKTIDPFARSQAIARTPPRHRALSLDDSDFRRPGREDEKENKPAKRKKPNGIPMPGVKNFDQVLKKTYKPKKEYSEICSKLILQTEILNSHELKLRPDEATCGTPGDDAQKQLLKQNDQLRNEIVALKAAVAISRVHQTANTTLLEDNKELSQEIDQLKKEIIFLKTTAERHQEIQSNTEDKCAECMKTQLLQRRKRQLKQDESFTSFQAVSEDDWGRGMFEKPLTQKGDIESQYKEVGRAIENFGGKHILKNQNRKEGEVAMMTHTLGFPDANEDFKEEARCLHYPILSNRATSTDDDDKLLFQSLKTIKARLISDGRYNVAIPETEDIMELVSTRMLQFLSSDTPIKLAVYEHDSKKHQGKRKWERSGRIKSSHDTSTERNRKPRQEAVIVRMDDKSFPELLQTVKAAINSGEIGVDIAGLESTRNNDLVLRVENGLDKARLSGVGVNRYQMVSVGSYSVTLSEISINRPFVYYNRIQSHRPGFSLSQALDMLNDDETMAEQVEDIFITPPDVNVDTDEDSGDEDRGGMIYNMTGRQLRAEAGIKLRNDTRIGGDTDDDVLQQGLVLDQDPGGDSENTISLNNWIHEYFHDDNIKTKEPPVWMNGDIVAGPHQFPEGKSPRRKQINDTLFGKAAAPLILMLEELPQPELHYIIHVDNLFTGLNLFTYLRFIGYGAIGTIRGNRVPNSCTLIDMKHFSKQSRGHMEYVLERNSGVLLVRWMDNAVVTMASTSDGAHPIGTVERYSQKEKRHILVNRPQCMAMYNKNMGGTDLMDHGVANYRIGIREKKWYWPIFTWLVDVSVHNAWVLYKKK
ncbi:hypothetical protein JTB14_005148 [Gonioctena quinquepunctata]|nr:hypothetical protein JTB14_005148 [Gonioctena quinquepunctata]